MAENSNHIEADMAAQQIWVWDLGPPEGDPERERWERDIGVHKIKMWSVNAQEAVIRDARRYCFVERGGTHGLPKGVRVGPAEVERIRREQEEMGNYQSALRQDPAFGTVGAGR